MTTVDYLPEYTDPWVLTEGVRLGMADPELDPRDIPGWTERVRNWLIPLPLLDGRPYNLHNPVARVRRGRNQMARWGENQMADALVTCSAVGADGRRHRYLLMVERADGRGMALPGGHVDAGDASTVEAAARELREETGLEVPADAFTPDGPEYVPDDRESLEAWAVTTVCRVDLGEVTPPPVRGGDDAVRAEWVRADSYDVLLGELWARQGFAVGVPLAFGAHRGLLAARLGAVVV